MSRFLSSVVLGSLIIHATGNIAFWTHNICPKCQAENIKQVEFVDIRTNAPAMLSERKGDRDE